MFCDFAEDEMVHAITRFLPADFAINAVSSLQASLQFKLLCNFCANY